MLLRPDSTFSLPRASTQTPRTPQNPRTMGIRPSPTSFPNAGIWHLGAEGEVVSLIEDCARLFGKSLKNCLSRKHIVLTLRRFILTCRVLKNWYGIYRTSKYPNPSPLILSGLRL